MIKSSLIKTSLSCKKSVILNTVTYVYLFMLFIGFCGANCPDPQVIEPCKCANNDFRCDEQNLTSARLADIFRSPPVGGRKTLRVLYIHGTNLSELRRNQFGDYKLGKMHLDNNQIKQIKQGAFNGTYQTLKELSLSSNKIESFPFKDIRLMLQLEKLFLYDNKLETLVNKQTIESSSLLSLNLGSNNLTSLDEYTFENLNQLEELNLRDNSLSTIEPNALLIRSKNKVKIDLSFNNIKDLDLNVFGGNYPEELDLTYNKIIHLKEDFYKTLLNNGTKITIVESQLKSSPENHIDCKDCTHRWLVDHQSDKMMKNLVGFLCEDGTQLQDLMYQMIKC